MGLYLGDINLTVGKKGDEGYTPVHGKDYFDGLSAYQIAQQQGFSGTEEEFGQALANAVEAQMLFGCFNKQTTWNQNETVFTETWTYNGDSYSQVITNSDPVQTKQLTINGVNAGLWTITVDEANCVINTIYTIE